MIRKIIKIEKEKCNGCGLCVTACHEGAIDLVDGKAELVREHYCDGLGDCLPACPMNAISFEQREAPAYDEAAVKAAQAAKSAKTASAFSCPGSKPQTISKKGNLASGCPSSHATTLPQSQKNTPASSHCESQLSQWPVQIKLVPVTAPYFDDADLLIAADCTAYAYGDFHNTFIKGRVTLVGCPKLDTGDYTEKLTDIFQNNNIKSITLTRMTVPCCGGLERAVRTAIENSKKEIPLKVYTIAPNGNLV